MEFDKVRFDGATVELEYREEIPAGGKRDVSDHGKDPAPAFKAALQSFASYVAWIHSWPEDTVKRIDVRGVTIKRPDDAPRGIVVTALLKCPHARNSTSTINTPFLSEPPANYNGDRAGFLAETTVTLIDELEERATDYQNGERGEQTKLDLGDSANTAEFNKRAAAAEVGSTRKPKGRKQPTQADTGVAIIANPDATEVLDDNDLRQLLLSVERDVPIDAIALWTSSERSLSETWARARLKEMLGELKQAKVPVEPPHLMKVATPALSDGWITEPPPKVSDEQAKHLQLVSTGEVAD